MFCKNDKITLCLVLSLAFIQTSESFSVDNKKKKHPCPSSALLSKASPSRRAILSSAATTSLTFGALLFGVPDESLAFPNKISNKWDDRPKRRGPQPKDLGVLSTRKNMDGDEFTGLKQCGAAPNCFSSTDFDDPDHLIPAWKWPDENMTKEKAFSQLENAVRAYEPGQSDIDGGGFNVVKVDLDKGYIYAQFEALKNGYIDDVEFAFIENYGSNAVQVRSSSRVGYLDFGK